MHQVVILFLHASSNYCGNYVKKMSLYFGTIDRGEIWQGVCTVSELNHSSLQKGISSNGVSFSRVVTPIIHLLHSYSALSFCTSLTQKSISVKSFLAFSRIPFREANMSLLAETKPSNMSSHSLLHFIFSKRKTNAPPFSLWTSSQTGLMFSWKRQIYEPTGSSVGRLKCWQYAQKSSTVATTATGLRLSSKVSSPLTQCWYQNWSRVANSKVEPVLSIISNNKYSKLNEQQLIVQCNLLPYFLPLPSFKNSLEGNRKSIKMDFCNYSVGLNRKAGILTMYKGGKK